jgi:hypothetical protein
MTAVTIVFLLILNFHPSIMDAFVAEFFAGFSGILIAFYLDRMIEHSKSVKISKQIIDSILLELHLGRSLINQIETEIEADNSKGYPLPIGFFHLFQTNAWKTFSSRLELDDIELLYELGTIYHGFELFNEAMKLESEGNELSNFLKNNPAFLEGLQKDIDTAIDSLEKLKI